jgi:hypothetical protein
MQTSHAYVPVLAENIQRSLEHMPARSSAIVRSIIKTNTSMPETPQDIERYVYSLLTHEEQKVCDMATD